MSQGLLSSGIAHWPGRHSDPMDGATSLPLDTVRLGRPRSCPRHPRGVRSACRLCTTSPSGLSAQRGVLCDHTPPLAPSSCPRITAIVLSSFVGRTWPAAEATFSGCRSRRGAGVGVSLWCGLEVGWWVSSPQRPWGWRAACGSGLGRGYSIFVANPAAKAPVSLSG